MLSTRHAAARTKPLSRAFSSSIPRGRERLVILGSGWGGYTLLQGIDKRRWDVVVLSPTAYFNFTPLLAGCAVGTLEYRCALEPVRKYSPRVTAYQAWCDKIDFKRRRLQCMPATPAIWKHSATEHVDPHLGLQTIENAPFTLRYDKLVIAAGAYSQTFNVPGVKENAHFLKDIRDARKIHMRIIECFEQANQPTLSDIERRNLLNFCIVGGGPTGVEFSAELHDFLHSDLARHYPALARLAKINLYDVAPQILSNFDLNLVQYTEKTFRREGISIWTNHHVTSVEAGKMFVEEQGEVPFGMLVWSTGLAPNPLIDDIQDVKKYKKLALLTDDRLNIIHTDGTVNDAVWAIGDCSVIDGAPLPATAQVANQKGKYLVKALNGIARDQPISKPFEFRSLGNLAYVGNWKAIYDRPGAEGFLSRESGRLAWLLWRSAYFTRTLSIRNRILLPFYWFFNWIFGRDLSRF
ncbi:putative protein with domain-containing protein [Lyophyllum shimeji]|uniref:FAD/NAD(P)-binding domain-containing protein n=1 Tax=Lyophyllum shimeji TaxID=47721 RepID=A0A9P3PUE5_LYOSH|nr:putative protein with domain-containing protein [Lyophyllum shimeji]